MDIQPGLSVEARPGPAADGEGHLRIRFKGSGVKQLLNSGSKRQGSSWRQDVSGEQQEAASPSAGRPAVSDSPGHPFSPSSAEASPGMAAGPKGTLAGPRSVHGRPPGKQPHPDDRTPEADAFRAHIHPQQAAPGPGSAAGAAGGSDGVAGAAGGADAALGARSVHGQPPGKQPHPDDPAFAPSSAARAAWQQQQQQEQQQELEQQRQQQEGQSRLSSEPEGRGAGTQAAQGARSVHGRPPGKQPHQIHQIEAAAAAVSGLDSAEERPAAGQAPPYQQAAAAAAAAAGAAGAPAQLRQAPWRRPQVQPPVVHAPTQPYAGAAPAGSGHQGAPQHTAAPALAGSTADKPASRKRPASQSAEGGQRKKPANGSTGGGTPQQSPGTAVPRSFQSGVPASLARAGEAPPLIRPMPGAPRSLQQRQQLLNGLAGGGAGLRQPAGAPRTKQPSGSTVAAAKPRQPASKSGGSAQRRGGASAAAAVPSSYKVGEVVWAKIGNYPWWPAQLQHPTADEHFKPKHAASDSFCVFYGSNDYNWLPGSALKPFSESHPDYAKHAAVKNKALQRAIDEAWAYGVQRQRPDVSYGAYGK